MTVSELLRQGIAACKAGRKAEARTLLKKVIEQDDHNETAWLWLSGAVETDKDRRICLENVLAINPGNELARKGLARLAKASPTPWPEPVQPIRPLQRIRPAPAPPSWLQPAPAPQAQPAPEPSWMEAAPGPAQGEPPAAPSPIAAEADVYGVTLPSETQPSPEQAPKEAKKSVPVLLWVLGGIVGVMIILIACAMLGLALGDQATAPRTPTPVPDHKSAIIGVIRENVAAFNAEDADRYMATIHPQAPGQALTRGMLEQSFAMYDLSVKVYNVKILELSEEEARVSFTLITKKISGPAFVDNRVDGVMTFRQYKGRWRLYGQENDEITYLD